MREEQETQFDRDLKGTPQDHRNTKRRSSLDFSSDAVWLLATATGHNDDDVRTLHKSELPSELTTIRRRRRRLTKVPGAPSPDKNSWRYSTDRHRSETRSKAGCFNFSGSHPLDRTHFSLDNFSLLLWPCVILRQQDTHTYSLKALTMTTDTRNRFRIRGSIRPEKKHKKKVVSLSKGGHPRSTIRPVVLRTGHTRAHSHTHARTHSQADPPAAFPVKMDSKSGFFTRRRVGSKSEFDFRDSPLSFDTLFTKSTKSLHKKLVDFMYLKTTV